MKEENNYGKSIGTDDGRNEVPPDTGMPIHVKREGLLLARISAIVFGMLWIYDGFFKFWNNLYIYMPSAIENAGVGQPSYLNGWFSFWYHIVAANPMLFTWLTGILELSLGFALVAGFARKIAYFGGIILALIIWSVPEGFGGPYGPGSLVTGSADIYAISFLLLIALNATFGPDIYTLDRLIEGKYKIWSKIAEIRSGSRGSKFGFFGTNAMKISRLSAILLGVVFAAETYMAVSYNTPSSLKTTLIGASSGQPAYLNGWYSFWISQVSAAPLVYYYTIIIAEFLIALALLFGFARKTAYVGGMIYSALEWSTLRAFGGPITAGYTDADQIVVTIAFLILLSLNAVHGTDPYTIDARIERKMGFWYRVAEMSWK
jgi:uncharacterized membrane protein YphA (DoxX/SURF4 family)